MYVCESQPQFTKYVHTHLEREHLVAIVEFYRWTLSFHTSCDSGSNLWANNNNILSRSSPDSQADIQPEYDIVCTCTSEPHLSVKCSWVTHYTSGGRAYGGCNMYDYLLNTRSKLHMKSTSVSVQTDCPHLEGSQLGAIARVVLCDLLERREPAASPTMKVIVT